MRILDSARMVIANGSASTSSDGGDSEIVGFMIPATGNYLVQVYLEAVTTSTTAAYTLTVN